MKCVVEVEDFQVKKEIDFYDFTLFDFLSHSLIFLYFFSNFQEEDDDEIENLRKIAMESLKKSRDNELSQEQQHFQSMNAVTHYSQPPESSSYDLEVLSYNHSFPGTARPPRMGGFHMQPRYRHPQHMNNFQPRHHMRAFAPHHHRPIIPPPIQQDFVPHPHVNPQFIAHQPPAMFVNNDFPPIEYVPTPAVRLSPRSAE